MTTMAALILFGLLMASTTISAAPLASGADSSDKQETQKSDLPVVQLEKLKSAGVTEGHQEIPLEIGEVKGSGHLEYHKTDAVKSNGELVLRLEEHATADAVPGEKPHVHAQSQLDVPSEGVHRVVVQEGEQVSVHDAGSTVVPEDEQKEAPKVFHGAARLIQAGTATVPPQGSHIAARRAFNADITKETKHNIDHYASYAGVQYSPLDMAEYVFWTGDERGVTAAIEEFLQEGMMTKEEAIAFLQEIKFNIEYLKAHFNQNVRAAEENAQQEKLRNLLMDQATKDSSYQYRVPTNLQSFPFGNSPDIIRTIATKNWDLNNALNPSIPALPMMNDFRSETVKRSSGYPDPMLQTNIIGTSDYDRDGNFISEEEYEEMMEKLKVADSLYTEYTLEEIIYQLAKMMFSQSLIRDPREARAAIQRFMMFLEMEAERGQLSRSIEKKVLDVMIAALSDTIGDHPELLQAREGIGSMKTGNRLMHQLLETNMAEPSVSRAILSAYKDEILKEQAMHKLGFGERN